MNKLSELLEPLAASDPGVVAQALEALLPLARARVDLTRAVPRLEELLSDPAPAIREMAALALLYAYWRWNDVKAILPALERGLDSPLADRRRRTGDTLVKAARCRGELDPVKDELVSAVLGSLDDPDLKLRKSAILGIIKLVEAGADLTPAVGALARLLSDDDEDTVCFAAQAIQAAMQRGQDVEEAIDALRSVLDRPWHFALFHAGSALATLHRIRNDPEGLKELALHAAYPVREGVAVSLLNAGQAGSSLSMAVEALGALLADESGGVVDSAVHALHHAAVNGDDLSPAAGSLRAVLDRGRYPRTDWTFGLDSSQISDLIGESIGCDAAAILTLHHLERREWEAVRALLEHASKPVAEGAIKGLKEAASLERFNPVKADIQSLLDPLPSPRR